MTNKLTVNSTTGILLQDQIFVDVFLIENNEYTVLRKELLISTFSVHFRTASLAKTHWINFIGTSNKIIVHCFFADSPLIVKVARSTYCSFGTAL